MGGWGTQFGRLDRKPGTLYTRVRPFLLKNFSLISEIERIWIRFTCVSLFHYKISLLFFRLFSLIFASNFLLRFTLVIIASKWNKAKRNSSLFFRFFLLFLLSFHFASIFSLNFRLFYLRFRFRFLVFRIEVNHVKSGFFSLLSETKFSLQLKISLPKQMRAPTLLWLCAEPYTANEGLGEIPI